MKSVSPIFRDLPHRVQTEYNNQSAPSSSTTVGAQIINPYPFIQSAALTSNNSYVDVTFSEGVYSTAGGSGALDASDFSLIFAQNGGTATNVTIYSVTKTNGTALTGGESVIRVRLTVTGAPNGFETIEIKPFNGTSIYDVSGLAASGSTTTGPIELVDQNWFNTAWTYRMKITIDHTQVAGNLTKFPYLVSIPSNSSLASHARSDGFDILFTGDDGVTKLIHETEKYVSATGELLSWVKLSSLSSTVDTYIYLYYGNPSASNQANPPGVWDSNYRGVWHLGGTFNDTTSNANNGTNSGTSNTTGVIVDGKYFNPAESDSIQVSDSASLHISNYLTVSLWAKPALDNQWHTLVSKMSASSDLYFVIDNNNVIDVMLAPPRSTDWQPAITLANNAWNYLVLTYDGSNLRLYRNGSEVASVAGSGTLGLGSNTNPLHFGYNTTWPGELFNGSQDEVRISSVARSAAWILTEYNNQLNATGAIIVGTPIYNPSPSIQGATLATNNTYVDVSFSEGVYSTSGGSGALDVSDFSLTFTQNGGSATGASIASLSKTTGGALTGGETAVRVNLTITGMPSGVETVEIKPFDGASIYDNAGNASSAVETTGAKTLYDKAGPRISSGAVGANNSYIDVSFNEGVFSTAGGAGALDVSDFALTFTQNGGSATGASIASLEKTTGGALTGGETAVRMSLTITGTPGGVETIEIKPVDAASIYDVAGNASNAAETTGAKTLYDKAGPRISSGAVGANNSYIDVSFNEGVFSTAGGAGALDVSDFALTFTQNGGSATGASIASLEKTTGGALTGGETAVRVSLTITGTPSGVETIEIKPLDGASIYDFGGNAAGAVETTGVKLLFDKLGPSIGAVTTADVNIDGTIDRLVVTFGEAVKDSSIAAGDFGLDAGTVDSITADGGVDDAVIWLSVTPGAAGTDVKPTVTVAVGNIEDLTGNTDLLGSKLAVDGAPPLIVSAQSEVGFMALVITFSEPVYTTSGGSGDLVAGDFTYNNVSGAGNGGIGGIVDGNGSDRAAAVSPSIAFVLGDFNADKVAAAATQIYDAVGNAADGAREVTVTNVDGTPPGISTLETRDTNGSGYIDRLVVTFNDEVDDTSIVSGNFSVSGGVSVSAVTDDGTSGDAVIVVDFTDGVLLSDSTPDVTIAANGIKDINGNWNGLISNYVSADRAPPAIMSVTANDPDDGDAVYGNGDTVTFVFSENTNQPSAAIKSEFGHSV